MDPNQAIRSALGRVKHTATRTGREALGLFSLEGTRAVERALRAGTPLEQVLVSESVLAQPNPREASLLKDLHDNAVPLQGIPKPNMRELTEGRDYGQLVALAALPAEPPLPPAGIVVVAVDIADPGNVGGMIRTSLAAGAAGFIATGASDPWHAKAVRTSMGSIFKLPLWHRETDDIPKLPGQKIATCLHADASPISTISLTTPVTFLLIGSEAFGLPDAVLAHVNNRARIPMVDGVDSYSVNVATGIALYALLHSGK